MDHVGVCFQGPVSAHTPGIVSRSPWPSRTVLSTWSNSETGSIRLDLGPRNLVLSSPLLFSGKGNVRNQKVSTVRGLQRLLEQGVEYSWKIRSDFEVLNLSSLTESILDSGDFDGVAVIDWVLHKKGYPMDFIQFGKTETLLEMWSGVRTHSLITRVTEQKVSNSFARMFAKNNPDRNAFKSLRLLATSIVDLKGCDIVWHKHGITLRNDWVGNPVFCQLSGAKPHQGISFSSREFS